MAEFLRHEKYIYHAEVLRYILESWDHHTMGNKSINFLGKDDLKFEKKLRVKFDSIFSFVYFLLE
jgi:hypothetical protein